MITRIWAITLTVRDLEPAIDFYGNTLGLVKKYQFGDYVGFDCGGIEIGLKTWGELEQPRKGEPVIDLMVSNLDQAYRNLRAKGVSFDKEPGEALWGARYALFKDPDGHLLQLTEIDWPKYFDVGSRSQT
jgi:catechol 2,3-dioxygenase-like lactoylglutathione lyase family enzyme